MVSGTCQFLIAMPALKSPFFSNSVILMAKHNEEGALGFIINMPTGTEAEEALKLMDVAHFGELSVPILFGGPVQPEFFWFIHSSEYKVDTSFAVHDKFNLTTASEIIPLLDEPDCPDIYYAGVGYSGWGPGQLDREIEEGSWWLGDFSLDLLFETNMTERWNEAFKSLGADPDSIIDNTDPFDPTIN